MSDNKKEKPLHLFAIQAADGVFIARGPNEPDGRYNFPADNFRYDGKKLESTWHRDWFKLDKLPELVEERVPKKMIREYVKLINPELTPDLAPEMDTKDCMHDTSGYNDLAWDKEYKSVSHLYEECSDYSEETWKSVPFKLELLGKLKGSVDDGEVFFSAAKESALYGETNDIGIGHVGHQLIDRMVFPPPMLTEKFCKLSSHASYRIIRQHVKDNIDQKYAEITSDYDFCFQVEKKIQIATPYEATFYPLFKPKRGKRKEQKRLISDRRVKVFEMTWSPKSYEKYTPIAGFQGKTHKDLKRNVDKFLADLMERVNEPLVDCPHCDGRGVVLESKKEQGNRDNQ